MPLDLTLLRETTDLEAKAAQGRDGQGALPQSVWETYSAMANTEGGTILLGVEEHDDGSLRPVGLRNPDAVLKDFWNGVYNPQRVNANVLPPSATRIEEIEGAHIVVIEIPRVHRSLRPVYLGANPLTGTYRRNHEGDYRCPPEVVRRLIADSLDETRDGDVFEGFGLNDLDMESLGGFRNIFRAGRPDHPWLQLDNLELLRVLGGYRPERQEGHPGLTRAGLLMFGKQPSILEALPFYLIDYQERQPGDERQRWIDRVTTDGTWSGNLFDFYRRVQLKLTADLKIPFAFRPGTTTRIDHTPIHEAVREALVNTLIHADYGASVGIMVLKEPHGFTFRNPGGMRVPADQAFQGGVSDCRNRNLQKMFQMIGEGEQVGSGLPRILSAWQGQHWRTPFLREDTQLDLTYLQLPTLSLLPERVLDDLDARFGASFRRLEEHARLAIATAAIEGRVTNPRLRTLANLHPHDATIIFQSLVQDGFLVPQSAGRWTFYVLPALTGFPQAPAEGETPGASREQVGSKSK